MKKLFMRLMYFLLIIFLLGILDLQIFGFVMTDFLSLIRMGDVITYHHTCILISGIPLMLYTTFAMVRVLFSNDLQYKALPDPFEGWVLGTGALFFCYRLYCKLYCPVFISGLAIPLLPAG
ncbi:hypothetical protein PYX06_06595 [Citrobacter amalonaticus]|nr:hypothetical protein [Citrobacter amalonaticus]